MGTNQTKSKLKYNRATYKRYEFNVRIDSNLNEIIEQYKAIPDHNLSDLIKTCLCDHFGIDRLEADEIFVPSRSGSDGIEILNTDLEKYFTWSDV